MPQYLEHHSTITVCLTQKLHMPLVNHKISSVYISRKYFCFGLVLVVVGFELRALHLLGKCYTT
jgi:hypothetical protein